MWGFGCVLAFVLGLVAGIYLIPDELLARYADFPTIAVTFWFLVMASLAGLTFTKLSGLHEADPKAPHREMTMRSQGIIRLKKRLRNLVFLSVAMGMITAAYPFMLPSEFDGSKPLSEYTDGMLSGLPDLIQSIVLAVPAGFITLFIFVLFCWGRWFIKLSEIAEDLKIRARKREERENQLERLGLRRDDERRPPDRLSGPVEGKVSPR